MLICLMLISLSLIRRGISADIAIPKFQHPDPGIRDNYIRGGIVVVSMDTVNNDQ